MPQIDEKRLAEMKEKMRSAGMTEEQMAAMKAKMQEKMKASGISEEQMAAMKAKMQEKMEASGMSADKLAAMKKPSGRQKAAFFMASISKLFKYMSKYRALLILVVILSVASAILNLVGPSRLSAMTKLITDGMKSVIDVPAVVYVAVVLLILYGLGFLFSFLQGQILASVLQRVSRGLRDNISKKINRLPLKYFDRSSTGDILSRVTNDVDMVTQTMNQSLGTLVSAITLFAGSLVMMLLTNWIMALAGILSTLLGFAFMVFIIGKSQKYFLMQQYGLGAINGHVEETYAGHTVIKAYNAEAQSKGRFKEMNRNLYVSGWKSQFFSGMMPPFMSFIGNLGYVVVCIVGAVLTMKHIIGFEVIVAFMLYIRLFTQPLTQFAQSANSLQSAAAASDRVFRFLEEEELKDERDKDKKLDSVRGDVEFDHVSFGYEKGKPIIHDFSASVKAGQKIAIVGPTGAGKTTMVNLLMRFYELDSGQIRIDGTSIQDMTRENIHDLFCMVLQDTWLFEGSIKENIRYAKTDATDEDVIRACKAVGLHRFIETLPEGYDTVLSDSDSLSAGQKQLVTIARAMVENAPMLILDEATSSVDTRTEILIQKAMDELMKGRTSFVIAHRLSTIKNADMILVMKDGDIIEKGDHEELMRRGGFYAKLYNSQFENGAAVSGGQMKYFEYLKEHFEKHGDIPAFVADGKSITYAEADIQGAKVYRFLKEKGIGKEQIVMLLLPKKLQFYPCMLGVLRAGAAFVLVQDDYPKERIDFIREDTKCALVIDIPLFEEIMAHTEPLSGYEETDPHQLCYLVYTSGSTGTPKGVLHEYGNIDECISMVPPERPSLPFERPLLGPLSFVQSILNVIYNTMYGITTLLEPEEKLRDFEDMKNYILEKKLKTIYLPPSYIRLYKDPSPYLENIGTGSEPAGGIYYPGGKPKILNTYSCSEAGFAVMQFELDKSYDVAPIGYPMPGVDAVLMDENDNIIEGPGQGELCFKNEFFRGYLNHPEQTARAKRGGYYHTNDICRRDKDGLYYVIGRNDDMVKINGNRIEPAEIEAAVQKCTGLQKVVAKGFEETKRSFVAAYFLEDEAKKLNILDGKRLTADMSGIEKILPSYMIPTYYVPVKEFPLNASGKIARKLLEAPKAEDFAQDYVAPENEAERALCESMAKVLEIEKVGAMDDFFILGGDSMGAINLVSECKEVFLSSKLIYQYRTPREIARHVRSGASFKELAVKNKTAMEKEWPLLPAQRQVLMNQLNCPESGAAYIGSMIRLPEIIDAQRMKDAVNRVLAAHPVLATRIFKTPQGEYRQKYDPEFMVPIEITDTNEDFPSYMSANKVDREIFDHRLYEGAIVRSSDGMFFYLAINHLIVEGSTINILMKDIFKTYRDPEAELPPDFYFALLSDMLKLRDEEGFREAETYFGELFDAKQKAGVIQGLRMDHESEVRTSGSVDFQEAFEIRPNRDGVFFMTAVMLATAWYNESDFAYLTSVYNDRDDPVRMTSVGFMASGLTFGLDIKKHSTPREMLDEIQRQNTFSIVHTEYSYALEKNLDTRNMVQFNFYKGMQQWKSDSEFVGESVRPELKNKMPGALVIFLKEEPERGWNGLSIRYAEEIYEKENMDRFAELLFKAVDFLEGK